MSETWETFCDEAYYHMWRVRKRHERGFNDGFHINNRDEAIGLCDLLNKMERELAEARQQRDRLAEALQRIAEGSSCCACRGSAELAAIALQALAAVKGGTP
jgi:hypothetical protein